MDSLMITLQLQTSFRSEKLLALRYLTGTAEVKQHILAKYPNAKRAIDKNKNKSIEELHSDLAWCTDRINRILDEISLQDIEDTITAPLPQIDFSEAFTSNFSALTPDMKITWDVRLLVGSTLVAVLVIAYQFIRP